MAVALLALFVALSGTTYAATGGNFILGQANTATTQTSLSSGVTSTPTLNVVNTGGRPAARFQANGGIAPFTVSNSTKIASLNGDLLDGLDSGELKTRGDGASAGFVNITGCGSGMLVEYAVTLTRAAKIFAAGVATYGRSNPGPERPTMQVQLLDGSGAVVAISGRVNVDATSGNPSLSVAGLLFAVGGGPPYTAAPGTYRLRLWADNFGSCTGFGQYQEPRLSHIVVN